MNRNWVVIVAAAFLVASSTHETFAEDLTVALSREEAQTVNDAVDRGLEWLAAHRMRMVHSPAPGTTRKARPPIRSRARC